MKISIAERLHPFSHSPGSLFLLPYSDCQIAVYPARLICTLIEQDSSFPIDLDLRGPIEDFTAELDLQRGELRVWGTSADGFFRYRLFAKPDGIWIQLEKAPENRLICRHGTSIFHLTADECLLIPVKLNILSAKSKEQLSLGMHKVQDWDLIYRRMDLKEIFPHWLRIGQITPSSQSRSTHPLLEKCRELIEKREKLHIGKGFELLFRTAFSGVCVPRAFDSQYQGILPADTSWGNLIPLLTESAALIRSLFFHESQDAIAILPCALPEFHCGRMVNIGSFRPLTFDIEWTKKYLRTVAVHSRAIQTAVLRFPKGVASCRIRRQPQCGKRFIEEKRRVPLSGEFSIELDSNQTIFFDHFE